MTTIFDNIIELPDKAIKDRSAALIGFENNFGRVFSNLRLLIDPEGLKAWSIKHRAAQAASRSSPC